MIFFSPNVIRMFIQTLFLFVLYFTQFLIGVDNKNDVINQMTNYFSYYDLSLFIFVLIPLFLFSIGVFMPKRTVYENVRMTKNKLYFFECMKGFLESIKFTGMYFFIGLLVFFFDSNSVVLFEYIKQTLIFFLMVNSAFQIYLLISLLNGTKNKVKNMSISVFLIMGLYFLFKDYFSFFNSSFAYYILNIELSIINYLPIFTSVTLFLVLINFELFKRNDFL
jgi:hypothetical protein